jgi:hypothetical protein
MYSCTIFLTATLRSLLSNSVTFPYIISCFSLRTVSASFNGLKKPISLVVVSAVEEDLGRGLKASGREGRRYTASEIRI